MDLQINPRAIERLKMLQASNPGKRLRITILGGGCSGFQYQFSLDDLSQEDDHLFEEQGIAVVVDAVSLDLLKGSELDYIEDMSTAMFVLKNPNAVASCGCGNSFAL